LIEVLVPCLILKIMADGCWKSGLILSIWREARIVDNILLCAFANLQDGPVEGANYEDILGSSAVTGLKILNVFRFKVWARSLHIVPSLGFRA
jgi:hypothetical protein